jgi:zinc protease
MQHELIKLNNHLQTLFVDAPGSTAGTVQVWFRAGSALENKEDHGIAHFLEHMFFKGTEKRPGAAIAHEVESFGGEINAFTSFDYTCYYINTPNTELDKTTEILLDMVSNPRFLEEDIVPERGVVFEEFRRSIDNPNQFGFQRLQKSAFTDGYAHPILGNEKTILSFSQDQLKSFRNNYYNLSNALLVVAGDMKAKDKIKGIIESYQLPQGPRSEFPKFKLKAKPSIDIYEKDTHMVQLSLCLQAPAFEEDQAPQEDLAINCLGHGESSRLYQELVANSSVATSCGSSTMFMNHGGLHYLKFVFPVENLNKVLTSFEKLLLTTLKDGLSDDEIQKIKNQYIASKVYDMESLESYAFSLGHSFASTGDINSEEEFISRIKNTTVAEVNDSLRRIFKRSFHLGVQLPDGKTSAQVEKKVKDFQTRLETKLKKIKNAHPKLKKPTESKFDSQVKLYQIKPGIKLIYRQNTMNPTFVMHAYLKGGITEENSNTNGLYQLISSTITRGYGKVSYASLKNELDYLSASLSAFSGKNAYGLTLHGQSEHFQTLLEHFTGSLIHPTFKGEHIRQEKEMTVRMLKNQLKDPVKQCFRLVGETFFKGHPYSMPLMGTEKSLKKLTGKLVKETHTKNLKNNEILITYCGDKSFDEVYDKLEDLFDSLPSRRERPAKTGKLKVQKNKNLYLKFDREQTQIFTGIPAKALGNKDNTALKMITTHLSGQSSELFVEVRDKQGLCYTAQPIHFSALEAGHWGIYMASGHDKVKAALKAIRDIIENLKSNGLSREEFDRVKKMIAGQSLLNIQTNDDYANIYSVTSLQGKTLDYYHLNNKEIENLNYEKFNTDLKRILSQKWSTVVVGRDCPEGFDEMPLG